MNFEYLKECKKKWLVPVVLGIIFAIISVILVRNEVFMDDWYIESSADGLFGADNRGLLTVGANYLFLGLIRLASLTGIRASWIHVFMVLMNMVSSILVCRVICDRIAGIKKYVMAIVTLLLIMPLVGFYIQFTLTSAYVVVTGCMWIFYSNTNRGKRINYIFGGIWILLGASMRFDAIYFAVVYMGSIALVKILEYLFESIKEKKIQLFIRKFTSLLVPFITILVIAVAIEVTNRMAMNQVYPGFSEWNTTIAHVDDYDIPDYYDNEEQYKKLGMSYNDYVLLKAWNNLDDSFYTEDLYDKIVKMKDNSYSEAEEQKTYNVFEITANMIRSNYALYAIVFIIAIIILSQKNIYCALSAGILLVDVAVLNLYFVSIRRLIWRTEWPLYTALIVSMITVLTCFNKKNSEKKLSENRLKKIIGGLISAICIGAIIFVPSYAAERSAWNIYNGKSLYQVYKERALSDDTYGRFFWRKITKKDVSPRETIDYELTTFAENNKQLLIYHLIENEWLQVNPLTNKDLFRSAPVGAGENFAMLGQYMSKLGPLTNNEKRYGVTDRFKDLTSDNIRVTAQKKEIKGRSEEIKNYLQEHYYSRIDFSVTDVLSNTAVGRFITELKIENLKSKDAEYSITCDNAYEIPGMICLHINESSDSIYMKGAENFLILTSKNGERHIFSLVNWADNPCAIIFDDALNEKDSYNVQWVVKENDNWITYTSKEKFIYTRE